MKHVIAFGGNNLGEIVSQRKLSWSEFRQRFLSEYKVSNITVKQYAKLTRERRAKVKNSAGWFVGGGFSKNDKGVWWRSRTTLVGRSLLALDIDHLSEFDSSVDDLTNVLEVLNFSYALYATPSSTPDDIRLRLVMPVDKAMRPEHYQPVGRWVAGQLDINIFDHTGFEECRLMYLPVQLVDGPGVIEYFDGDMLCRNDILRSYDDWKDSEQWASSAREGGAQQHNLKAEDPRMKSGVIGTFCRAFNIHDVIDRWLQEYFTRTDDNTYLPTGSTGAAGARVYDDESFLYNNHETGTTSKQNLNAFDLVRVCLFHELDDARKRNVAINKRPSYRAMVDFALQQPEVQKEFSGEEFADFDEENGTLAPKQKHDTFDDIMEDIATVISGSGTRAQLRILLTRIANARFSPTDERALIRLLIPKYPEKMAMGVLESEIKDIRRATTTQDDTGEVHDLELELIQEFENEYYPDKTIKRIGKRFWTFHQGLWSMVDEEIIHGQFGQTVIRLRKERPEDAREIAAMVGDAKTSALAGSLQRMMTYLIAQRDSEEDPLKLMRRYGKPVVNCRNAELHFNFKGQYKVKEHAPEHFYTTRIDADYDPDAECPLFDAFLEHAFDNAKDPMSMIQFAEELGGYTIQMSRWLKIWIMCYGPTNTGKTTYSEVITSLLGGAAIEKKLDFLKPNAGTTGQFVSLIGKLLFVDDDMSKGAILPDGDIKRISEEKVIQTDVKFGDDIRFVCHAFPMICTNHWPRTHDMTDAFVQRTVVMPFLNPYKIGVDANDRIKAKMLSEERSGILNRFIAGLSRLRERGRFEIPIDSKNALQEWLQNANPVAGFIANCVRQSVGGEIRTIDLFDAYINWNNDEYGHQAKAISKQEFYRRCETQLGRRKFDNRGNNVYKGWQLTVKDEFNDDDDPLG